MLYRKKNWDFIYIMGLRITLRTCWHTRLNTTESLRRYFNEPLHSNCLSPFFRLSWQATTRLLNIVTQRMRLSWNIYKLREIRIGGTNFQNFVVELLSSGVLGRSCFIQMLEDDEECVGSLVTATCPLYRRKIYREVSRVNFPNFGEYFTSSTSRLHVRGAIVAAGDIGGCPSFPHILPLPFFVFFFCKYLTCF